MAEKRIIIPNVCEAMADLKSAVEELSGLMKEAIGIIKENIGKGVGQGKDERVGAKGSGVKAEARAEGSTPLASRSGRDAGAEGKGGKEEKHRGGERGDRRGSQEEEVNSSKEQKERDEKKKNLVIKGLNWDEKKNLREVVEDWISKSMGRWAPVEDAEEKKCGQRGRIIIARMKKEEDVREAVSRKREIAETARVAVDRDFTFVERGARWMVKEKIKEEKIAGNEVTDEGYGSIKVVQKRGKGGEGCVFRWKWNERTREWEKTEVKERTKWADEAEDTMKERKDRVEEKREVKLEGDPGREKQEARRREEERLAKKWEEIERKMEEWKREMRELKGE